MDNHDRVYSNWIQWSGGLPIPVRHSCNVTIRQRCGQEFDTEFPHSWDGWDHKQASCDIVAYRLWWPK